MAGHDGDADRGEAGVEDVGAVSGGGHPGAVDLDDAGGGAGEVLGHGAETGSGLRGAGGEVGFAGVLVLDGGGVAEDA